MDKDKQVAVLKGIRHITRRGAKGVKEEKLMVGDLVKDNKNGELGIFLGIKPGEGEQIYDYLAKKSLLESTPLSNLNSFPINETCILLTLQNTSTGTVSRIRYTNSKYIKKLEEDYKEDENLTDLENHCQNECFLDCDPGCSLFKYRRKDKIKA